MYLRIAEHKKKNKLFTIYYYLKFIGRIRMLSENKHTVM